MAKRAATILLRQIVNSNCSALQQGPRTWLTVPSQQLCSLHHFTAGSLTSNSRLSRDTVLSQQSTLLAPQQVRRPCLVQLSAVLLVHVTANF